MNLKTYILPIIIFFTISLNGQVIDPASLPEVEDYTVVQTNPDADTVILVLHGGPTNDLLSGSFFFMESIPTFSVVEVKKHEMLIPVLNDSTLTLAGGHAVNDTTAALIEKAVQYYNDLDKTVVLIGHSWGAIVLGEYLDDYGVDNIHRIIPMEGRLNMQLEMVDYLLDGYLPTFQFDGLTLEVTTPQNTYDHGLLTLAAAIFSNRWVDSLANIDLSKMMYSYAENDQQTGALTFEETEFLDNSGAQTLFIPSAGHGASFYPENQQIIVDFIREQIFVDVDEPLAQNDFNLYPTLANNSIQIESEQQGTLRIFDMHGKAVYQGSETEASVNVDVSNLENGMYVAVFYSSSKAINTAKFQVVR